MMSILHTQKKLQTLDELNNLKIKYNLSIVPYYNKKYNLKDDIDFCNQISSSLQSTNNNIEFALHGLYHQVDGKMDDFDIHTKEEEEKNEIQQGLDICHQLTYQDL
jgi:predicted deacetylase